MNRKKALRSQRVTDEKLLVRFEGFQDGGCKDAFPMFTVMRRSIHRGPDGTYYNMFEPDTTVGPRTLRDKYNVFMPDKFDRNVEKGTLLMLYRG